MTRENGDIKLLPSWNPIESGLWVVVGTTDLGHGKHMTKVVSPMGQSYLPGNIQAPFVEVPHSPSEPPVIKRNTFKFDIIMAMDTPHEAQEANRQTLNTNFVKIETDTPLSVITCNLDNPQHTEKIEADKAFFVLREKSDEDTVTGQWQVFSYSPEKDDPKNEGEKIPAIYTFKQVTDLRGVNKHLRICNIKATDLSERVVAAIPIEAEVGVSQPRRIGLSNDNIYVFNIGGQDRGYRSAKDVKDTPEVHTFNPIEHESLFEAALVLNDQQFSEKIRAITTNEDSPKPNIIPTQEQGGIIKLQVEFGETKVPGTGPNEGKEFIMQGFKVSSNDGTLAIELRGENPNDKIAAPLTTELINKYGFPVNGIIAGEQFTGTITKIKTDESGKQTIFVDGSDKDGTKKYQMSPEKLVEITQTQATDTPQPEA